MSYVRVAIQGTASGGEVWSINPVFDPTGEIGSTVNQTALDTAALAIANLDPGGTARAYMSTAFTLTGARLEVRDDVTNDLIGLSVQGRTTPLVGSGSPKLPMQAAVVISLRTDTPGARGRGRLYWPALGTTLDSTVRMPAVDMTALLSQMQTYFKGMESALESAFSPIGFNLAVRSRVASTTPHVTRLQVGNVVDTQRRRRDKLVESYQNLAY